MAIIIKLYQKSSPHTISSIKASGKAQYSLGVGVKQTHRPSRAVCSSWPLEDSGNLYCEHKL